MLYKEEFNEAPAGGGGTDPRDGSGDGELFGESADVAHLVSESSTQERLTVVAAAQNPLLEAAQPLLRALADMPAALESDAVALFHQLLEREVAPFQRTGASAPPVAAATRPDPLPSWPASTPAGEGLATRDDILRDIRKARRWFENHEPSSPVAVLLKQAERMTGLRFSQVADAIPLDLLRKWDADEEASL